MPNVTTLTVDVEVTGLDDLKETIAAAEEVTEFKAEMGNGMSFRGTKSDFVVFIDGLIRMTQLNEMLTKRGKY